MPPMPPPQQQATPRRTRAGWITLCYVLLVILLAVGVGVVVFFFAWLSVHPSRPRFTVSSLSVSGGRVAFNVSATNPNRHHIGVIYKGATRASLWFHGAPVASGSAFVGGVDWWYQPAMDTASIAGVLDTVKDASFQAAHRAGRIPLRLQLITDVTFTLGILISVERRMHVNCDVLVGTDGGLLRQSVGAPCESYFLQLTEDD